MDLALAQVEVFRTQAKSVDLVGFRKEEYVVVLVGHQGRRIRSSSGGRFGTGGSRGGESSVGGFGGSSGVGSG